MIRTVIAVVDDMFFVSKIRATAKALGLVVKFPRTVEACREIILDELPSLIVVDLHHAKIDPLALAMDLKAENGFPRVPLLGFFSHVDLEMQRKATEAGYDEVMPRSLFARDLAQILAGT